MDTSALPRLWWGVGAGALALITAASAALVIAPDGHFAFGVESASSAASGIVQRPGATFPRIYAFFAGMVAALNPCGFALLPGYLGLYLHQHDARRTTTNVIWTPIKISLTLAVAFVGAFGVIGVAVGVAGSAVSNVFPLVGLLVGVVLIAAGAAMLAGWTVIGYGQGIADRLGGVATGSGLRAYFAYGLAYALASLGCALPVFLTVVGSALLLGGGVGEFLQVLLYGVGMAVTLTIVTMGAAIFKTQILKRMRVIVRIFEPLSAALLLVVGAYVVYYWLTIGGVLRGLA